MNKPYCMRLFAPLYYIANLMLFSILKMISLLFIAMMVMGKFHVKKNLASGFS
jgi:hypothetical protein